MREIIVFDLDGTLLSHDSMRIWITEQLKSHPLRWLCGIMIMPIALVCMRFKPLRYWGISLFLHIAIYGLNEQQLQEKFKDFALRIKNHSIPDLYWFQDGLLVLKAHLDAGRSIILVTGCLELLAKELMISMELNVEAVGTTIKNKGNQWMIESHCINEEKVRRLKLIGIDQWLATYSDDPIQDRPILMKGKYAYLINSDHLHSYHKIKNLNFLQWR